MTAPFAGPPAALPPGGQVCVMLAFDIEGFTRSDRDEAIRIHLHKALYEILVEAFEGSGVPWDQCRREDRGDGALVILPPGMPGQPVIDPFPERLRGLLRRHNGIARDAAQMRLRAAAHIGLVYSDEYGAVGDDINLLFRMLEAAPLRRALAGSATELALIISDYMHDSLVIRHRTVVDPALFRPLKTQVKRTRISAWTYLPGMGLFLPATETTSRPSRRTDPAQAGCAGPCAAASRSVDGGTAAAAGCLPETGRILRLNARGQAADSPGPPAA
jgi:hypothetical protein